MNPTMTSEQNKTPYLSNKKSMPISHNHQTDMSLGNVMFLNDWDYKREVKKMRK